MPWLVAVLVVYLVIIQGLGLALSSGEDFEYGKFPTTEALLRSTTVPVAVSVVFVLVLVGWLGWWPRVRREPLRLGRWAWIFPAAMLVSALVMTDYSRLGDVGTSLVLALLATTLLVGIGEEVMFRGVALWATRDLSGWSEVKAALVTAVIFGGVHITNIFTEGPGALGQAVVVSVAGLFFYIARRVSGGLLVPVVVHAVWDFSLFSSNLGSDPDANALAVLASLTTVVLAIVVIVRRKTIWPTGLRVGRVDSGQGAPGS